MELYEDPPRRTSVGKSDELRVGPCVSLSVCIYRVKRPEKETTPYTRHKSLLVVIGRKAKSLLTHRRTDTQIEGQTNSGTNCHYPSARTVRQDDSLEEAWSRCIVGSGRACGCVMGRACGCVMGRACGYIVIVSVDASWSW